MFAGAVREAVFSRPEVIKKVKADFIPVVVRAGDVEGFRQGAEGRLFAAIRPSRAAPQGIGVLNGAGQVLNWVLMFDRPQAITEYLDYAKKQYAQNPDGKRPVAVERFHRYPTHTLPAILQAKSQGAIPAAHPQGQTCPHDRRHPPGSLVAQVYGRAVDGKGKLVANTLRQENYIQDQMTLTRELQAMLTRTLTGAKAKRVRLPESFARLVATHAHLGMLDVRPLGNPLGGSEKIAKLEFWAERAGNSLWRLTGESDVSSALSRPGVSYEQAVKLTWTGLIKTQGDRVVELILLGKGTTRLRWGTPGSLQQARQEDEVRFLPAGRPIDVNTRVRFGILAMTKG